VGWQPPEGGMDMDQWAEEGLILNAIHDASKWARGDWYAYGEHKWGAKYDQGVEDTQLEEQTLRVESYVSRNVDLNQRRDDVSWTHHRMVAPLPSQEQERWLEKAAPEPGQKKAKLTVAELRQEIKHERDALQATRLRELGEPDPFGVVYADPPWRYQHQAAPNRAIENHYETEDLEEIKGHWKEVNFAEDCVLFLWATSPKLGEAFEVLAAWGFEYRTSMVWVKPSIGPGYYARQRHEFLLIARRGFPTTPDESNRPDSVIEAPRLEHSAKPEQVYKLIEAMYPDARKLEMYSRTPREGWQSWGYEAAEVA
jgi:N6-adenosine-specific RNA methylase IME4